MPRMPGRRRRRDWGSATAQGPSPASPGADCWSSRRARWSGVPLSGRAAPARGSRPAGSDLDPDQAAALRGHRRGHRSRSPRGFPARGRDGQRQDRRLRGGHRSLAGSGARRAVLVPEIALATPLIDRLRHDLGEDVAILHSALAMASAATSGGASPAARRASWSVRAWRSWRHPTRWGSSSWTRSTTRPTSRTARRATRRATWRSRWAGWPGPRSSWARPLRTWSASGWPARAACATCGCMAAAPAARWPWSSWTCVPSWPRATGASSPRPWRRPSRPSTGRPASAPSCSSIGAGRPASCSAATAATCRSVRSASARWSSTPPSWRCAVTTAVPRPPWPAAARPAVRCASATSGAAPSASSRSWASASPTCASPGSTGTWWSARARRTRVIDDFTDGRTDVLVGTSLVAKGLDVPEVTLVGVVSADIALNLPDERAAERTWQLLCQAVGRAGRGDTTRASHRADLPAGASGARGRGQR